MLLTFASTPPGLTGRGLCCSVSAWCWYPSVCGPGEHSISTGWALFAVCSVYAMASYWLYAATAEQPLFSLALFKTSTFAIGIWGQICLPARQRRHAVSHPALPATGPGFSRARRG